MDKLTGQALLAKTNEVEGLSAADQAKACGYVMTTKDGKPRVNFTAFYKAVALARGHAFPGASKGIIGRELSYSGKCGTSGQAIIGPRYMEKIGLKPGDTFEIEIDEEDGVIVIGPTSTTAAAPAPAVQAESETRELAAVA
jgi:bifunctional DNA-binding transcriptional regulator/antitoxin component of YhaV-PrlF toxin-antitoxin module